MTVLMDNVTFEHTHPPILEEEINTFESKTPLNLSHAIHSSTYFKVIVK
jgi:hypothetical protein